MTFKANDRYDVQFTKMLTIAVMIITIITNLYHDYIKDETTTT